MVWGEFFDQQLTMIRGWTGVVRLYESSQMAWFTNERFRGRGFVGISNSFVASDLNCPPSQKMRWFCRFEFSDFLVALSGLICPPKEIQFALLQSQPTIIS